MFRVEPHTNRTLSWWYNRRDQIDFNPPYQRRGKIWTRNQKEYLIDSILNGYDLPKIYLANFNIRNSPLNTAKKAYAVIDGKQRLESIFDFFQGTLQLAQDFKYSPNPELPLAGLSLNDLRKNYPAVAEDFEQFNLDVVSVDTDEEDKISELFVRLNSGKDLSGAEVRNAMVGAVPKLVRILSQHEFFTTRIAFGTQRGQEKNTAAKLLLIEFRGRFTDTKKAQLDRFTFEIAQESNSTASEEQEDFTEKVVDGFVEESIYAEHEDIDSAAGRVRHVLDQMTGIFANKDPLLKSQGPLVLYYWLVRNHGDSNLSHIRPFLISFNRERDENRKAMEETGEAPDSQLLHYNIQLRAINDQGALVSLYDILEERLLRFVKSKPTSSKKPKPKQKPRAK